MVMTRTRSLPPTALYTSKATALCSDSSRACQRKRFLTSWWPNIAWTSSLLSTSSASVAVKCSRAAVAARLDTGGRKRSRALRPRSVQRSNRFVG